MRKLTYEPNLFWEDRDSKAIEAASRYFQIVQPPKECFVRGAYEESDFSLMRGSLNLARRRGKTYPFARADKWLPAFREHCVNQDAYFTDLLHAGEVIRKEGAKFLRSVSPFKELAGDVFDLTRYQTELAYQRSKDVMAGSLIVVVAEPVHIVEECRFIFVNNKLAGWSKYMENGELCVEPNVPEAARELAEYIGSHPYFLNIWDFVVDLGRVGEDWHLVEVNAFETSSFYAADCDKVYRAWAESLATEID
jgi:hypothetical protein